MKKKIGLAVLIVIFTLLTFMLFGINAKKQELEEQKNKLISIPSFVFTTLLNEKISITDLDSDQHTVIVYFSTECTFCTAQIEKLLKDHRLLENTRIILLSTEKLEIVKDYAIANKLINLEPELTVSYVKPEEFEKLFGNFPVPTLFLYSKYKKLVRLHKGILSVDSIKTYYNEY